MEEESFELLSSMSPKVQHCQKHFRKGTTVLALRKSIRKSLLYDRSIYTVKNDELNLIELNSDSTSVSSKSSNSNRKLLNATPIVISDSDSELSNEGLGNEKHKSFTDRQQSTFLKQAKLKHIEQWIDNVKFQNINSTTSSAYTELSTICAEDHNTNFITQRTGRAVNSTVNGSVSMHFDEFFKRKSVRLKREESVKDDLDTSIIEESYDENRSSDVGADLINDKEKTDSLNVVQQDERFHKDKELEVTCGSELASMLDDLYGDKWREHENEVLPKLQPRSEPRKQIPKPDDLWITNTERKPKTSKSVHLLKTLQKKRLKNITNFPKLKSLQNSYESDSDSNGNATPRRKLNFKDSDSDSSTFDDKSDTIESKYFKDVKRGDKCSTTRKKGEELGKKFVNDGRSDKKSKNKASKDRDVVKNPTKVKTKAGEVGENHRLSDPNLSTSSDDDWEAEITKIIDERRLVTDNYTFLASLSGNVPIDRSHPSARIYRNHFKSSKDGLLRKLFELYNEKVFGNAIPRDTKLEWSDRMRGTAGFCYCKKITKRTGAVERTVRIVLATKVVDAANRLRDTLIHEMCHAAAWIVNCVSDGHGPYWKNWARKAMTTFPELPPIKRCHDYVVNTKYTYKCTGCGYSIGRHSKSLDIERKRCGYCLGRFEILINKVTKKGETKSVPATPKKEASGFALFVKENYGLYKQQSLKHGDVMKLLGQKFQQMKLKSNS